MFETVCHCLVELIGIRPRFHFMNEVSFEEYYCTISFRETVAPNHRNTEIPKQMYKSL